MFLRPCTELWIGANAPLHGVHARLGDVLSLPIAGRAVVHADPTDVDADTALPELVRQLALVGRRLDAVVVAADALDVNDGRPCGDGVGAHRRAAWVEVADRVIGPIDPVVELLHPGIKAWQAEEDLRGVYDPHKSDRAAAWVAVLAGRQRDERSVVLESPRPLDPGRLLAWMMQPWPGVVRARGFVWTLDRPSVVADLNRVGEHPALSARGTWWVSSPSRVWPRDPDGLRRLQRDWHPDFGDRVCRVAVLGDGIDLAALQVAFERALVPESELGEWTRSAMTPDRFAALASP